MTEMLQNQFVLATSAALICFLAGVFLWHYRDLSLQPLCKAFFALSPFMLFCWGTNALEVAGTVEQMLVERKPIEIRPASQQAETFWASLDIQTEGGNRVRFADGGGWSVAGTGDTHGSRWSGPVSAGIGRTGRESVTIGQADAEDPRPGGTALHVPTLDGTE
jgi:hypothetical protein